MAIGMQVATPAPEATYLGAHLCTVCLPCALPPRPPKPPQAEAQCAWLESSGLVDGVVTDDNDVFLFGARHVYRHIFESKK